METMDVSTDKMKYKPVSYKAFAQLYTECHDIPLVKLLGDRGNMKIPATTAIFNMTSASDCPSKKLGLCKAAKQGANCYARKAEYFRPFVLSYRKRQEKFWKNISAEDFAFQFLTINAGKRVPFQSLRWNEAGDFVNQDSVNRAEKIARILKRNGIKTYCYTSRSDLNFSGVRDMIVSGSNFKKEGIKNIFKIILTKKDRPRGYGMCKMSCKVCNRCQLSGLRTCVVKH